MKKGIIIIVLVVVIALLGIGGHLFYLSRLKGPEVFPQDTYLDQVTNKTALVIVAHDDDAIGCSGTISELVKKGWKIHFLTFYGKWRNEDNPARKKEVEEVAKIQQLASIDLVDFSIQKTDTVKEPWMPVPYARFADYMKVDSLRLIIANAITHYQPSVLFTLDNVTGAYGHPEHACVSQCAIDVCNAMKMEANFPVKRIYQSVYTRSMSEKILGNNPTYVAAKKIYQAEGMPMPDVEIDIYGSAKEKKKVMLAYHSQSRNLKKVWPYYHWYPYWLYFKIFSKEYFNVITINE
jgi:LmbE family N-acetylglucosaminyl deacetylase